MSAVMCDVMDCKHIRPMERVQGGKPFLGFCKAELVNIFGTGGWKCLTYETSPWDIGETEQKGETR